MPDVEDLRLEVIARRRRYDHVLAEDWPPLPPERRWWNRESQRARALEHPEDSFGWLQPFMPRDASAVEALRPLAESGPVGARLLLGELRRRVVESAQPASQRQALLHALYAAAILTDFVQSLECEIASAEDLLPHVDRQDLAALRVDFDSLGFEHVSALGTNDVEQLVEAFGEPRTHQRPIELWRAIRRGAVARYCWIELHRVNEAARVLNLAPKSMDDWLAERILRDLRRRRGWAGRVTIW